MPKDIRLSELKTREESLFQKKQAAFEAYKSAKTRANEAYEKLASAREKMQQAREAMNAEFERVKATSDESRQIWNEYRQIKNTNSPQIDALKSSADYEHQEMGRCFDNASQEYHYGDRAEAAALAEEGREHRARRNELNEEMKQLIQEIKNARSYAENHAPQADWSSYKSLKAEFEQAKGLVESAKREFEAAKSERERLKTTFEALKSEHLEARNAAKARTDEVRAERESEREQILSKAEISPYERDSAKIVKKTDGTTHIYSGGVGGGDGLGHGHTVLDMSDVVAYARAAFTDHGAQNFRDGKEAKPKRGNWTKPERGVILGEKEDYPVTFAQGIKDMSGQTLIADGHVGKKEFHAHHNHYGLNDKSLFPDQPNRIEDSDKHKDDHYYTGPGH